MKKIYNKELPLIKGIVVYYSKEIEHLYNEKAQIYYKGWHIPSCEQLKSKAEEEYIKDNYKYNGYYSIYSTPNLVKPIRSSFTFACNDIEILKQSLIKELINDLINGEFGTYFIKNPRSESWRCLQEGRIYKK